MLWMKKPFNGFLFDEWKWILYVGSFMKIMMYTLYM